MRVCKRKRIRVFEDECEDEGESELESGCVRG